MGRGTQQWAPKLGGNEGGKTTGSAESAVSSTA
jgi:hypothetical protein